MTRGIDHIDVITAPRTLGPSPLMRCSRPSCRLAYRAHTFADPVPCPMCGQPFLAAKHGPMLTEAQREAMA